MKLCDTNNEDAGNSICIPGNWLAVSCLVPVKRLWQIALVHSFGLVYKTSFTKNSSLYNSWFYY